MYNPDMKKIKEKYAKTKQKLTPVRSIKLYCKEMCCAGDTESWMNCSFNECFLHPFRMGKRNTPEKENDSKKQQIPLINSSRYDIVEGDRN